ncbi:MAG: hypothetical protein JWQ43_4020 [Glaciihabitans sp.]|nr:hypothetical protein [Glaciihabitans sp.]
MTELISRWVIGVLAALAVAGGVVLAGLWLTAPPVEAQLVAPDPGQQASAPVLDSSALDSSGFDSSAGDSSGSDSSRISSEDLYAASIEDSIGLPVMSVTPTDMPVGPQCTPVDEEGIQVCIEIIGSTTDPTEDTIIGYIGPDGELVEN